MSVANFKDLKAHVGHSISVVLYGDSNVTIECEDCNEILLDFDKYGDDTQDDENVQLFYLGAIVEIGVPINKALSFKTTNGLKSYAERMVKEFASNVKKIGKVPIGYTSYRSGSYCEIKNFDYSAINQFEQNEEFRVFRFFGFDFFTPMNPGEEFLCLKNDGYMYKFKDMKVRVDISSMSRPSKRRYKELKITEID